MRLCDVRCGTEVIGSAMYRVEVLRGPGRAGALGLPPRACMPNCTRFVIYDKSTHKRELSATRMDCDNMHASNSTGSYGQREGRISFMSTLFGASGRLAQLAAALGGCLLLASAPAAARRRCRETYAQCCLFLHPAGSWSYRLSHQRTRRYTVWSHTSRCQQHRITHLALQWWQQLHDDGGTSVE